MEILAQGDVSELEAHFSSFRNKIIGIDHFIETPFGKKPLVYTDWTASGRLYASIENLLNEEVFPLVGNTHTETTETGKTMTRAYHKALETIKRHINAGPEDVVLSTEAGMTGVVNKFQRILGFRLHEKYHDQLQIHENERPIVFVTHMEHHSNQTSWLETIADVQVIRPNEQGTVDLNHLLELLKKHKSRKTKVAAVTSCSNVTGIITEYHEIAKIMHENGGLCFVDFACSAPYIQIDMHPEDEGAWLDAVYFSPHKFLGGPGSTGVLAFNKKLYHNRIPDSPGGGTVDWTTPWGEHKYHDDIEAREDGGTPAFLQTIRTALAIRLKDEMGTDKIRKREEELLERIWEAFDQIPNLHILAGNVRDRLGVISFVIEKLHYNLVAKLLNDRFGVQVRGGCSCAGTYGHYLLNLDQDVSEAIIAKIDSGDLSLKPGWVRMSIHPTMTSDELNYVLDAIKQVAEHGLDWAEDYKYNPRDNEFYFQGQVATSIDLVDKWFSEKL